MLINKHLMGDTFEIAGNDIGILLIHGLTATTVEIALLAKHLGNLGYSIYAPCLPGHGTTIKDLSQTKHQAWIDAVESAYQKTASQCKYVFVGGESFGATLALYLAAKHPEIKGVLAYAPAIEFNFNPLQWLFIYLASPFITSIKKSAHLYHGNWQGYDSRPLKTAIEARHILNTVKQLSITLHSPIFLAYAKYDQVIDVSAIESWANRLPTSPKMMVLNSHEHTIILGEDREKLFIETVDFIRQQLH